MTRPLTILDIGAVTPLGTDWPTTWDGLLAGRRVIQSTGDFGFAIDPPVMVGAITGWKRGIDADGRGPAARLIRSAADQVRLPGHLGPPVIWAGSNHGETSLLLDTMCSDRDPLPRHIFDAPCSWVASACTTGLHALLFCILEAQSRRGAWLAAAGDALSDIGVAGFARSGATGRGLPEPLRDGSPGMLVSEGAVALGLATCEAEGRPTVRGIAASCDADHPTHPDPTGGYIESAVRSALRAATVAPQDVVAVVAHGTGTAANDGPEAEMIARTFPQAPALTSPKGGVGHIMGAAGLLNVAIAAEIWRTGLVPPTAGDGAPRAGVGVSGEIANVEPRHPVLVLASGFGGNNVAAVLG